MFFLVGGGLSSVLSACEETVSDHCGVGGRCCLRTRYHTATAVLFRSVQAAGKKIKFGSLKKCLCCFQTLVGSDNRQIVLPMVTTPFWSHRVASVLCKFSILASFQVKVDVVSNMCKARHSNHSLVYLLSSCSCFQLPGIF